MGVTALLKQQFAACCDLLLPSACHFCGRTPTSLAADGLLCRTCLIELTPLHASCRRCRKPFSGGDTSDHLCEACLRRPPPFRQVICVGLYTGLLKTAIQRFKCRDGLSLVRPLGWLLMAQLPSGFAAEHDLVVPIPLHPSRLRHRGDNQALELARPLARGLALPCEERLLQRGRATPAQQGLPLREHTSNLRGAFSCRRVLDGDRVLLVDDVMTSGTTVAESSTTLLAAGATSVSVAVIGRA